MTEQPGQQSGQTPRPSWLDTPPAWYTNPPQHSTPQQQQSPPSYSGGNSDLAQKLDALPEKIVNAIREATGQNRPQQQQQPPAAPPATPPAAQTPDTPPKEKTFAEKWFGE